MDSLAEKNLKKRLSLIATYQNLYMLKFPDRKRPDISFSSGRFRIKYSQVDIYGKNFENVFTEEKFINAIESYSLNLIRERINNK